jgi:hypothetical protein
VTHSGGSSQGDLGSVGVGNDLQALAIRSNSIGPEMPYFDSTQLKDATDGGGD